MRALVLFLVLFSSLNISAQSPIVSRLFSDGTKAAAIGRFEQALKYYRSAFSIAENEGAGDGYLSRLYFNIGVCLFRMDQPEPAVRALTVAIQKRRGNYPKAWYALGMSEIRRGNLREARVAFEETLKLNGRDGEAWFDLAFVHLAEGNFATAEQAFRRSVEFKSIDAALSHNNIGVILALNSDFSAAAKEFETALVESDGRLIEARSNLEFCRARIEKRSDLIGEFEFRYASRKANLTFG